MRKADTWRCTVPVPLMPQADTDPDEYFPLLERLGAGRVLLWGPSPHYENPAPLEHFAELRDRLRERIPAYERHGFRTGFWLGHTIGHSSGFSGVGARPRFQQLVGPTGKEAEGCFCPADAAFREHVGREAALIAESGVELIVLDDDFRMMWHGPDARVTCFCPLHLRMFADRMGRAMSREEIVRAAYGGEPSPVRTLWLATIGQSMMDLAREIERAVHAVNPAARVGLCSTMGHFSGCDGIDTIGFLKALAGGTRMWLRTIGAPYWSREPSHVAWATEYTRLQREWVRGHDIELLAECDTWPHTRYHCSAAMFHAYQQFLIASGFPGVLSYPFVYDKRPSHEPAYVEKAERSREHYAALRAFFPPEYRDLGVTVFEKREIGRASCRERV